MSQLAIAGCGWFSSEYESTSSGLWYQLLDVAMDTSPISCSLYLQSNLCDIKS